ncbi:hypothetical protein ACFQY0_05965 [Haloferula chungangensis]|uniref:Phage tail collar domain-containing protein n=1 Tax=Haloferula chungangensis TaxID=1048331 RepID=A0ABW2L4P5_9BACT
MKAFRTCLFSSTLLISLIPGGAFSQIEGPPDRIDYQGLVLDTNGNPLAADAATNYSMSFRLYDSQTAGTLIWSESQTVTVYQGAFSVRLGEGTAIEGDNPSVSNASGLLHAFAQKDRYLGLTVIQSGVTTAEITPRLAFLASPFSFNSHKAIEADSMTILDAGGNNRVGSLKLDQIFNMSTTSQEDRANPSKWTIKEQNMPAGVSVPVGGVIMWWGSANAIPPGFELCSGGTPSTAGALISTKPDLRDRFVKGSGSTNGNVASNNSTGGSHTIGTRNGGGTALAPSQLPNYTLPHNLATAAAGNHSHTISDARNDAEDDDDGDNGKLATGQGNGLRPFPTLRSDDAGNHTHAITGSVTSGGGNQAHSHTVPGHDNRPAYLEMFYIIRVK